MVGEEGVVGDVKEVEGEELVGHMMNEAEELFLEGIVGGGK